MITGCLFGNRELYSVFLSVLLTLQIRMGYKQSNIRKADPIEPLCSKTIYNSQEEAQEMIKYIKENRRVHEIRAYKCMTCGFWHLTSKAGK
jgi:hypothetical protein